MKLTTTALAFLLGIAACGGKSTSDSTTTGSGATATTAAAVELGEMTLWDGDDPALKIHADGTTEMGYRSGRTAELKPGETWSSDSLPMQLKPGPKIEADGTIAIEGEPKVRINADGTITNLVTNAAFPIAVTADKLTVTYEGRELGLALAADGKLTVFGNPMATPAKPLRIEGADTPGKRRTMLSFIALNFLPGKKEEGSSAGSASEPAVSE
jgi:hypothetical protein